MDELEYAREIVHTWLHKEWKDKPKLASLLGSEDRELLILMITQALKHQKEGL